MTWRSWLSALPSSVAPSSAMATISGSDARRLVEAGARLVDVRSPEEFSAGHLPAAINLPLQQLALRKAAIGSESDTLIVYCRSGARSASAVRLLRQLGFERVYDLGSLARW